MRFGHHVAVEFFLGAKADQYDARGAHAGQGTQVKQGAGGRLKFPLEHSFKGTVRGVVDEFCRLSKHALGVHPNE